MRKIVVWTWSLEKEKEKNGFIYGPKKEIYKEFFGKLSVNNHVFFAQEAEVYKGEGVFGPEIGVYDFEREEIILSNQEVTADVIYNYRNIPRKMAGFDPRPAVITNTPEFKSFCLSKTDTYNYLPEYHAKTFFTDNETDFHKVVALMPGNKFVAKPNTGSNGVNVYFLDKETYRNSLPEIAPFLEKGLVVQDFMDTGRGIPGIVGSYHDLRIITIDDKISLVHVREPVAGRLVANFHQGGKVTELDFEQLPVEIKTFYTEVHKKITERFPRVMYSMDIGLTERGPKLFELNGHTSFPHLGFRCKDRFITNLINHLETI